MTHQFNTETSKRLMQMDQSTSQSTFRDSARQALMASKQVDGTLRIHTPFQELQSKKVANLKQKLTQLNSLSSSMRCQSGLHDSSEAASATAATSSAPRRSKAGQQAFQYRPNSNISGLLDISNKPQTRQKPSYTTDLTRFSQNSLHKDLSPLRVSKLASNEQNRQSSKGRQAQLKQLGIYSAIQNPRRTNNFGNKFEDDGSSSYLGNARPIHDEYENKNRNSVSKERQAFIRSHSCPRSSSAQSLLSNQSSPERLVNIVCPPSKGPKNRKAGQKIPTRPMRPRSDTRQQQFNSFCSGDPERRKQRMLRQVQAMGSSFGISASTSSVHQLSNNLIQQKKMMTPIKSKKQTMSRSGTKTKSQSHSRLGIYKNELRNSCSSMGLSPPDKIRKSAKKKVVSRMSFSKYTPSKSHLLNREASAASHMSAQKSARSWASASENSNVKHRKRYNPQSQQPLQQYEVVVQQSETSKNPSRGDRRAAKYLKNQRERSNSIRKKFKFASLDPPNHSASKRASSGSALKASHRTRNEGQTTGKFQSFNEGNLKAMLFKSANNASNTKLQHVAFAQSQSRNLATEDDFAETLTASSEESPERGPSQRVQRAAAMTTKAYLEDVNHRLENANQHAQHQLSVKEFGPRKMQAAYQGINKRQADRLQNLKEQMQESLIESHHLQSKLQTSGYDERGRGRGRGEGVSQFNSLVLQFSQNLENMATDLIESTERKRKNLRMKEYIAEMQEIRRQRSQPRHHSGSYSRHGSAKKITNSNSKRRSGSRSSRSNRSRSSKKGSIRKSSNKKNLSLKKRRLSTSKGKRRSKSKSKSVKRQKSAKSARSRRSGASGVSSRGRSRSRSLIKSVKRNIYKQTNGFRDIDNKTAASSAMHRPRKSRSRKRKVTRSQTKSKSRSRSVMNRGHSLTAKTQSRVKELAKKCSNLMSKKFNSVDKSAKSAFNTKLRQLRRSISRGKNNGRKSLKSKSRSKSNGKLMRKKTKSRKSRSKSVKKSQRSASKSPFKGNVGSTPNMNMTHDTTPNKVTPCMTPLHNILRNTMGEHDGTDPRSGGKAGFRPAMGTHKKVKIQSRRLQDVMQLSSSDSDSSNDSEDSLDNEMYLKRQQAHLSPWQRACLRKQLPKKLR